MKQKIRFIIVVSANIQYVVGGKLTDGREVGSIDDDCVEYPDAIEFIYRIYDTDGHLIAAIENCPVVIEYFEPEVEV